MLNTLPMYLMRTSLVALVAVGVAGSAGRNNSGFDWAAASRVEVGWFHRDLRLAV